MARENLKILLEYARIEKIWLERFDLEKALYSHQNYPSIFALGDILNQVIGVETLIVNIDGTDLMDVDSPAILHIVENGKTSFVLATKITQSQIQYFNGNKTIEENLKDFLPKWSGHTLLMEKSKKSGLEKNLKNWLRSKELLIISILLGLFSSANIAYSILFHINTSFLYIPLILLTTLGLIVSFSLVKVENGESTKLSQKVCSKKGSIDCDEVVRNGNSKLFNIFSWSKIGVLFFGSQFIFLGYQILLNEEITAVITVLLVLNITAIPFIVYNLFVQYKVIGKWCTLCLITHATILVINAVLIISLETFLIEFEVLSSFLLSFLIALFWQFSLGIPSARDKSAIEDKRLLNTLKYDKRIFNALLDKSQKAPDLQIEHPTIIGNEKASNEITVVSSLFCDPCAKLHPRLNKLVHDLPDDLFIKIILVHPAEADSGIYKFFKFWYSLTLNSSSEQVENIFSDWLEVKDKSKSFENWMKNHSLKTDFDDILVKNKMDSENDWIAQANVNYTPTVFFNGYKLPEIYSIEDIKYLIN